MLFLNRREFLTQSAHAAVAAWHGVPAIGAMWGSGIAGEAGVESVGHRPRLLGLRLLTAAPLEQMKAYYGTTLGLPILAESATELTVKAGLTPITFVKVDADQGTPWYHVAFNIPENKLTLAREWQLERGPLKQRRPGSYTLKGSTDIADFWHWNAHAVFFWDPAGNLLEYIARHDLKNAAPGPFTPDDILYASEIGLMADDVPGAARIIREAVKWDAYIGANDAFQPIGDAHGLMIVFPTGRPWTMQDGTLLPATAYKTVATIRGERDAKVEMPKYPYTIITKAS